MRTLLFLSKPDCPLCDEGYEKLTRLAARYSLAIEKRNIESDPELWEAHRYRIPVVLLDGEEIGWGRLSERGMDVQLRRRMG